MPIIKSAKKKLRKDKKRTQHNYRYKKTYKEIIKKIKKLKDKKLLNQLYSSLDKAAKKGIIHKNKANRLKSNIIKLISKKT